MKTIALLPMKANSQRVPGKNFRLLDHKPLFRWVLDTLLAIKEIDMVVINTDARPILLEAGLDDSDRISIQERPAHLIGDAVSMNRILEHDIKTNPADRYLMTHTTNPFLSSTTICECLDRYEQSLTQGHDSLFTVDKVQLRFYSGDAKPINHDPNTLIQTQDLEPWYAENSNLYIFSAESFVRSSARIGQNPVLFLTPRYESIDIDNEEDWIIAETFAEARHHFLGSH